MNRWMKIVSLSLVLTAAGCGSKKKDPAGSGTGTGTAAAPGSGSGSGSGSAPGSGSGSGSAPGSGSSVAPGPGTAAPHPSQAKLDIVEGAACPTGLRPVTDTTFTLDGSKLRFVRGRGGGCPTKPVYVAVWTKASPMPVRICEDITADMCEMMIENEKVEFDLSAALTAAGATAAVLAK